MIIEKKGICCVCFWKIGLLEQFASSNGRLFGKAVWNASLVRIFRFKFIQIIKIGFWKFEKFFFAFNSEGIRDKIMKVKFRAFDRKMHIFVFEKVLIVNRNIKLHTSKKFGICVGNWCEYSWFLWYELKKQAIYIRKLWKSAKEIWTSASIVW